MACLGYDLPHLVESDAKLLLTENHLRRRLFKQQRPTASLRRRELLTPCRGCSAALLLYPVEVRAVARQSQRRQGGTQRVQERLPFRVNAIPRSQHISCKSVQRH